MYELTKYNISRPQQMFQLHRLRVEREKLYILSIKPSFRR